MFRILILVFCAFYFSNSEATDWSNSEAKASSGNLWPIVEVEDKTEEIDLDLENALDPFSDHNYLNYFKAITPFLESNYLGVDKFSPRIPGLPISQEADFSLTDQTNASWSDFDFIELAKMHIQAWKESYLTILDQAKLLENCNSETYLSERVEEHRAFIGEAAKEKNKLFIYVLYNNQNEIVGFCKFGKSRTTDGYKLDRESDGEIYTLYLLDEVKGCGLGSKLWNKVCEKMKTLGWSSLKVWTLENNTIAREFYKRKGGQEVSKKNLDIFGDPYKEIGYLFSLE